MITSTLGLVAAAPRGLGLIVGIAYVALGICVSLLLTRKGVSTATAISALACWPLLLPLVHRPLHHRTQGPFGARIEQSLQALRQTMSDPAADDVALPDDLEGLVADLWRTDERLALVDRLLANVCAQQPAGAPQDAAVAQSLETLRRARASAAAEVEAVLDGIVQLRLQIGLRSLAGNSVPVRERLRDLRARLAAVDEIAALELNS